MNWRRKISGGVLTTIGYLLSPLSWWNDAFINIPLALGFAWVVSLFNKSVFEVSLIIGYWLTNVLGFVLMHKGAQKIISNKPSQNKGRELLWDVVISLIYTALIVALVKLGVFKPFGSYFQSN